LSHDVFLDPKPKGNSPKRDCLFYNWGGDYRNPKRPTYPREYGARCECHDKFFIREGNQYSELQPNCHKCTEYELAKE